MSEGQSPTLKTAAEMGGEELLFARLRQYIERYGRTAELRMLRDHLERPGVIDFWDPFDIWDPSSGSYSIGIEPEPEHGR